MKARRRRVVLAFYVGKAEAPDTVSSALSVLGYLVHFDPKKYPKL